MVYSASVALKNAAAVRYKIAAAWSNPKLAKPIGGCWGNAKYSKTDMKATLKMIPIVVDSPTHFSLNCPIGSCSFLWVIFLAIMEATKIPSCMDREAARL